METDGRTKTGDSTDLNTKKWQEFWIAHYEKVSSLSPVGRHLSGQEQEQGFSAVRNCL